MWADWYQSLDKMRGESAAGVPRIDLGEGARIRGTTINKNAYIGTNVRLLNEKGLQNYEAPTDSVYLKDGLIVIPKNTTSPNGTLS
jgi:ADP-glucose pyrophosphorylase